jgi:NAD(P)-dependent dehydrogenase (short-subunit alcohol dehydrogenase family)
MPVTIDLTGKRAFVTGAARGIGRAIAERLAEAGATVVLADRLADDVAATAAAIPGATAHALDVTDKAAVWAMAEAVGAVDILVNNAGVMERTGIGGDGLMESWDRVTAVIASGTAYVSHAFLPGLIARQGCIVNTASINSFVAATTAAGYVAAKGAVAQLTKAMAVDLAPQGVRVNAVAPGIIATPMTEDTRADRAALDGFLARVPMGRVGQPAEIADAVAFLASDRASYITGEILAIDGGYLAR